VPVTYEIDAKERVIRTRCVGNVTLPEVIAHFRELEHDSNCIGRLDVLLDLSETSSLPESAQISAVTLELKKVQTRVEFAKCAVAASRDALFGMLKIFEVKAQPYFRAVHVFRGVAEAEAWLVEQRLPE
jgi:hypothetical protein